MTTAIPTGLASTASSVLQGLPGQFNMSDDIIVYGTTRQEHDQRLETILDRLSTSGLTLNEQKCEFARTEMDFYGIHVGAEDKLAFLLV